MPYHPSQLLRLIFVICLNSDRLGWGKSLLHPGLLITELVLVLLNRSHLYFGQALNSTTLLTFILFWTITNNFIHLF